MQRMCKDTLANSYRTCLHLPHAAISSLYPCRSRSPGIVCRNVMAHDLAVPCSVMR